MAEVTKHVASGNTGFAGMRQNCNAALFMDGSGSLFDRHAFGYGFRDPQGDDMAFTGCYFDTRNNVEGVMSPVGIGPQAGIEYIMIGNRNYIQATPVFDVI
jgi:hypothetical protein